MPKKNQGKKEENKTGLKDEENSDDEDDDMDDDEIFANDRDIPIAKLSWSPALPTL